MADIANAPPPDVVDDSERRWSYVVAAVVAFLFAVIVLAGVHWAAQPPSNVETIDASRLHLAGEFMEGNLGTEIRADGSAVVRVIAQQYSFVPQCIVVPTDTRVVFRVTSPDVVHGFLIAGTNVNSMVVPGFVAEVRTRFDQPGEHVMPCHEYCSVGHEGMWARVKVVDRAEFARAYAGQPGLPVYGSNRLVLAHFWAAFIAFAIMIPLGAWQMLVRSPLHRWVDPEQYYRAVTAHGTTLAYIFPTLIAMGFGYAVCAVSLGRPMHGMRFAWTAFFMVIGGAHIAIATVAAGDATVLYTFYPPLTGSPFYYVGVLLAVVGSWIWVGLMVSHFVRWKRDHPGLPVPLAMFATVAGALLWAWTSLGAGAEIIFLILPNAFGWTSTIDAGLARLLFSWTLHAIVYFWLIPAYIAFYVLLPQAAGGRLYSDKMGRIAFLLLLVFSMPIGFHHLFADPQIGAGFKFIHTVFTAMVAVPTLLTVFTICASLEIAGRLRGGRGLLGWIGALPWDRPLVLASGFSLVMLGLGGAGGLINMSYALNSTIHNTQWVTGHFHLIYGGAIVIMYFAIAYELWPRLTGRPLVAPKLVRLQLWTWFVGMLVTTLPWHLVGLMGQPRRMAYYDYTDPALAPQAIWVSVSAVGGFVLVFSALLLIGILIASHRAAAATVSPLTFSLAVHPPRSLPRSLNGFRVWVLLVVALTVANYGYPVAQSLMLKNTGVAAYPVQVR